MNDHDFIVMVGVLAMSVVLAIVLRILRLGFKESGQAI